MKVGWLKRYHLAMILVWVALAWPGLTVWRESIVFVIALSLYANIEASFAAYQGARSEEKQDDQSESAAA